MPGMPVAGTSGGLADDDIAAEDSELEEGEVSPPRSETPTDIKLGGKKSLYLSYIMPVDCYTHK